ncbi:hypothetical protein [Streptomyces sp. NPDC051569]|uniref:hypothetical protein n=1 Tax=Streptomyces sp. NPDC051569 TaxID=3365661 RepID=UPI0037B2477D
MNPTPKTETTEPDTAEAAVPEQRDAAPAAGETTRQDGEPTGQDGELTGAPEDDELDGGDLDDDELAAVPARRSSGLGAAAASILAVCLGIVALTGTWTGRVVSERETLVGQINTGQTATPAQQISEIYGDAWHATAAINGVVALLALLIGGVVLALPQRAGWVRPFAVAGAVLGLLGLLLSAGMYFDTFVDLPSPPGA